MASLCLIEHPERNLVWLDSIFLHSSEELTGDLREVAEPTGLAEFLVDEFEGGEVLDLCERDAPVSLRG